MLYNKGLKKADILDLYSFIDWVLGLPKPLEKKLMTEIEEFEEEQKVAYITSAERIGIEKRERKKAILIAKSLFKETHDLTLVKKVVPELTEEDLEKLKE